MVSTRAPGEVIQVPGSALLRAREVRRGALLALHLERAVGDELPDRQREVLGGRPELFFDWMEGEAGFLGREREEARRELLEFARGALGAAPAPCRPTAPH